MDKNKVIAHFGGIKETAQALGVTQTAVRRWGKEIPQGRAYQIHVMTNGALKSKPSKAGQQQA